MAVVLVAALISGVEEKTLLQRFDSLIKVPFVIG